MIVRFSRGLFLVLAIFLTACSSSLSASRLFLYVATEGWYRVTGAQLQAAGVDLSKTDPATFQLLHDDQELALRVQGRGQALVLDFYGQASDSPYSAFNVYALQWGARNGKRIRDVTLTAPSGMPQDSFSAIQRVSHPLLYIPQSGMPGDPWFWQALTAPTTTTITLTLAAAQPGPAHVRVNLWGYTQDNANPDHHIRAFLNDTRLADEKWDGPGARALEATVPVREGENILRLVAPGDTQALADVVLLSSVELTYTRQLSAEKDAIAFEGNRNTYRVDGFSGDGIDVFDVTDPNEPTRIANAAVGAHAVSFSTDSEALHRWSTVGPNGYQGVVRIVPMPTSNVRERTRGADYLVITHPDFVGALQSLVKWRADHGLKPVLVTTSEIYAEFGYGAESPLALRAFLNALDPKPRFVLLVGKASYDYRDYLNAPNKNLVPTFLIDTVHLNQAASDNWFAATSASDIRPAFAIGRIPAKSADEVSRVVNKIIGYESTPSTVEWRQHALFIADDKEPTFASIADDLVARLPPEIAAQKIYLAAHQGDVEATRAELLPRWNVGALAVTYVGHGSLDTWAEGPLFSPANLGDLKNEDRLPILLTPTCLDGFFYHPIKDSLAEQLLFKADGGVIAGIVPTGLSIPDAQDELLRKLFTELFESRTPTLGEALGRAKQRMNVQDEMAREVVQTFGLLGDPALRIVHQ